MAVSSSKNAKAASVLIGSGRLPHVSIAARCDGRTAGLRPAPGAARLTRALFVLAFLILLASALAFGQTYTIYTIAGGGVPLPPNEVLATTAALPGSYGVAVDSSANLYIASRRWNAVFRITAGTGVLTLYAGNGTPGYSGVNGPAASASLNGPIGVAVDSHNDVFIADTGNHVIRKVSGGTITTVAGTGASGYSGDSGLATSAQLKQPQGVAISAIGDIYVGDTGNNVVRKVSLGLITTVAGNGTPGYSGDNGPATKAQLNQPYGVVTDNAGNLYIADNNNSVVRRVANGVMTTFAGNGGFGYGGDNGPAASAVLYQPAGVAVDSSGNVYIADLWNYVIRKVSNGVITTIAGISTYIAYTGDGGPATRAGMNSPYSVAVDASGNVYISDWGNSVIRKISNGIINTIAGGAPVFAHAENTPATSAVLSGPGEPGADAAGNLYFGDNCQLLRISNGLISTFAGTGVCGYSGDGGPALSAQLIGPGTPVFDAAGNMYFTDGYLIRKISNGVITTIAGNGTRGYSGDGGPAIFAALHPSALGLDAAGNVYVADDTNRVIREISNGIITSVAGTGVDDCDNFPDGPALTTPLCGPVGFAVDGPGNLYVAGVVIRKILNGVITTIAGNGGGYPSGDGGPAIDAGFGPPQDVAVDPAGNVYIADWQFANIRKISNGIISTIAGNGRWGYTGDGGPATSAELYSPGSISVDAAGNVYLPDGVNHVLRVLVPDLFVPPPPAIGGLSPAAAGAGAVAFTLTVGGSNFTPGAIVNWNGAPLTTGFVNPYQVTAAVPAGLVVSAGTANVTVTTAGGTSVAAVFTTSLHPPLPAIGNLIPAVSLVGAGFPLTVNGANFLPGAVVRWGTTALTTSFVSAVQLIAQVPAGLAATPGNASLTVVNLGGFTSPAVVYSVQNPAPSVGYPPVNASSGMHYPFTFTFSDPLGYQNLGVLNILFAPALDGRHACYLAYSQSAGLLYLVNDAGDSVLSPITVGSSSWLTNSQCSIFGIVSSASGNTLTLTLNVTFATSFAGPKVIYLAARDLVETNSGWQRVGTWLVPGLVQGITTAVNPMTPYFGSGSGGQFVFSFSDTKGTSDLGVINIVVNDWLDGRHACYVAYVPNGNILYLVDDSGYNLLPPIHPGGTGNTYNSQCVVNAATSSVSTSGNTLTLALDIGFATAFSGNRVFYLAARDKNEANNTGWWPAGAYSIQYGTLTIH